MSIKALSAVMEHSEARGTQRVVMFVLADHSDDYGFSWPGVERIAHKSRVTPRAVQTHLASLKLMCELAIHPRKGRSNVYQILLPDLLEIDPEEESKLKQWGVWEGVKVSSGVKKRDANLHPNHKEPTPVSIEQKVKTSTQSLTAALVNTGSPEDSRQEPSPFCPDCKTLLDPDRYCQGCGFVWVAS